MAAILNFKKAMNEILHTLQKIFSYAYINSYQLPKKSVLHFHLKCNFSLTTSFIKNTSKFDLLAGQLIAIAMFLFL